MSVHARELRRLFVTGLRIRRVKQLFVEDICHPHCGLTAARNQPFSACSNVINMPPRWMIRWPQIGQSNPCPHAVSDAWQ